MCVKAILALLTMEAGGWGSGVGGDLGRDRGTCIRLSVTFPERQSISVITATHPL